LLDDNLRAVDDQMQRLLADEFIPKVTLPLPQISPSSQPASA